MEAFGRLRKRLRLPEGSAEALRARVLWEEAQLLADPASFKRSVPLAGFWDLFGPYASQSPHLTARLAGCDEVWLLAATIGPKLPARAQECFAKALAFEGYVMDFFGTWLADQAMRRLVASLGAVPGTLTRRLMPGTRGFALEAQGVFVALAGEALGLSLTTGFALVPEKSVTAVIGRKASFMPQYSLAKTNRP